MSEPRTPGSEQIQYTFNDRFYCPNYDAYLRNIKARLKQRERKHLTLRERQIPVVISKTIHFINGEFTALGYTPTPAPHYSTSFTRDFTSELTEFDAGIDHWTGPIITDEYKAKFHKNELKPKDFISNQAKFNSKCVNRLDQVSWNVFGKFFAVHIKSVKKYLVKYFRQQSDGISNAEKEDILNRACVYFAVQLLSATATFERTTAKPLIRVKTLTNSSELHSAFKILHNRIEISELKQTMKSENNNNNRDRAKGSKYRIISKSFAENVIVHCTDLLNALESANADWVSDTTNNSFSPQPSLPAINHNYSDQQMHIYNPSYPPPQHNEHYAQSQLPFDERLVYSDQYQRMATNEYYYNNYGYYPYGHVRGGTHIGSTANIRDSPYPQHIYSPRINTPSLPWEDRFEEFTFNDPFYRN